MISHSLAEGMSCRWSTGQPSSSAPTTIIRGEKYGTGRFRFSKTSKMKNRRSRSERQKTKIAERNYSAPFRTVGWTDHQQGTTKIPWGSGRSGQISRKTFPKTERPPFKGAPEDGQKAEPWTEEGTRISRALSRSHSAGNYLNQPSSS